MTTNKMQYRGVEVKLTNDGVFLDGQRAKVNGNVERFLKKLPMDEFTAALVEYDTDAALVSFVKPEKNADKHTLKAALGQALSNGERAKSRANVVTADIQKLWGQLVKAKAELKELAASSGYSVTVTTKADGSVKIVTKETAKSKAKKKAESKAKPEDTKKTDKDLFTEAKQHAAEAHAEAVADQA